MIDIRIQPRSRQVIGSVATVRNLCSGERPASGAYGAGIGRPSTLLAIRRCALASHRVVGIAAARNSAPTQTTISTPPTTQNTNITTRGTKDATCRAAYPVSRKPAEGWIK